jgi:hypothetical protein
MYFNNSYFQFFHRLVLSTHFDKLLHEMDKRLMNRVTGWGNFRLMGTRWIPTSSKSSKEAAQIFGKPFPNLLYSYVLILTKKTGWATFWATFSHTHLRPVLKNWRSGVAQSSSTDRPRLAPLRKTNKMFH